MRTSARITKGFTHITFHFQKEYFLNHYKEIFSKQLQSLQKDELQIFVYDYTKQEDSRFTEVEQFEEFAKQHPHLFYAGAGMYVNLPEFPRIQGGFGIDPKSEQNLEPTLICTFSHQDLFCHQQDEQTSINQAYAALSSFVKKVAENAPFTHASIHSEEDAENEQAISAVIKEGTEIPKDQFETYAKYIRQRCC